MNENKVFFGNENLGELSAIEHCIFEPTHLEMVIQMNISIAN